VTIADVTWMDDYRAAAVEATPVSYGQDALSMAEVFDPGFAGLTGFDAEEQGWQERALCAETDPEAFFPEKGGSTREAKKICTGCEVRAECLEYALGNDERFGIWGGLSERERRRLRRRAG
jgi:WhiB family transcriptional regulator, redox-sensing transcriptional regulator